MAPKTMSVGIVLGILALFFLTQCAPKPGVIVKEDEGEILQKRAKEYWNLVINVNPGIAEQIYYQYEAPAFREMVPFIQYFNRYRMVKYYEAVVTGVEVEGEKARVTLSTVSQTFLPRLPKKVKDTEVERWVKAGGKWYHLPREWVTPE
jgi:hypothetical protein